MEKLTRIFDLLTLFRDKYSEKEDVFIYKSEGKWVNISSADYVRQSDWVSFALFELGLAKGDRVATIMGNRPTWNFLDMGILRAGCVHVPVYPTLSLENYRYIFQDAGVKVIFIGCHDAFYRIEPALKDLPDLRAVFVVEKLEGQMDWSDMITLAKKNPRQQLLESMNSEIAAGDLATLIYTSGTTGRPKGVMLSHANLVSNFTTVSHILDGIKISRALSFLPLCHVYERMLNYMYQYLGITVCYAEHIDRLRENMKEVGPEIFCAVPRVIEKTYATIHRKGRNLKGLQKRIFFWALNLGHRYDFDLAKKWPYRLQLRIADRLVFSKWRQAFGNRLSIIVSGGAPLHPRLAKIFWAAGIKVIEGYGLTETSPVIAVGTFEPDGVKFGTVGKVLPGVELKLAEDNEILVKGPNVMMGYFNHPELNAEVFDSEGWFHTGDIGQIEDGVYLRITDRKKEIFKTSLGKYIAPQVIENHIKTSPFVESIMVIGENRNYLSALIVPSFEYIRSWCEVKGIEYTTNADMAKLKVIVDRIQRDIHELNQALDHTWQVRKFVLMDKEWSVQSGELSPTLKVRRTYMQDKFAGLIAQMYGEQINYQPKRRYPKAKPVREKGKRKKRGG